MDGNLEAWQRILVHLYPVSRPNLSMESVYDMLPLLHKYNIKGIMDGCLEYLKTQFPASLSPDPNSPCYIINWLKLADDLQLDDLKTVCMAKVRDMARNKKLGAALLSPSKQGYHGPRPASCPNSHATSLYPACPAWCNDCVDWVCCGGVPGGACTCKPSGSGSAGGCRQPTQQTAPISAIRHAMLRLYQPQQLADNVKGLSEGIKDDLLASLAAACNCKDNNCQ